MKPLMCYKETFGTEGHEHCESIAEQVLDLLDLDQCFSPDQVIITHIPDDPTHVILTVSSSVYDVELSNPPTHVIGATDSSEDLQNW